MNGSTQQTTLGPTPGSIEDRLLACTGEALATHAPPGSAQRWSAWAIESGMLEHASNGARTDPTLRNLVRAVVANAPMPQRGDTRLEQWLREILTTRRAHSETIASEGWAGLSAWMPIEDGPPGNKSWEGVINTLQGPPSEGATMNAWLKEWRAVLQWGTHAQREATLRRGIEAMQRQRTRPAQIGDAAARAKPGEGLMLVRAIEQCPNIAPQAAARVLEGRIAQGRCAEESSVMEAILDAWSGYSTEGQTRSDATRRIWNSVVAAGRWGKAELELWERLHAKTRGGENPSARLKVLQSIGGLEGGHSGHRSPRAQQARELVAQAKQQGDTGPEIAQTEATLATLEARDERPQPPHAQELTAAALARTAKQLVESVESSNVQAATECASGWLATLWGTTNEERRNAMARELAQRATRAGEATTRAWNTALCTLGGQRQRNASRDRETLRWVGQGLAALDAQARKDAVKVIDDALRAGRIDAGEDLKILIAMWDAKR